MAPVEDVEDALAQAVKDTVDLLKTSHGAGGVSPLGIVCTRDQVWDGHLSSEKRFLLLTFCADGTNLSEDDVMRQFSEQLQGLDKDPNMAGVMESMMSQLLSKEFLYDSLSGDHTILPLGTFQLIMPDGSHQCGE